MKKVLSLMLIVSLVCMKAFSQQSDHFNIVEKPDTEAFFAGGEEKWLEFLKTNLNPNIPVINKAPKGEYTIVIKFIVDSRGSAHNPTPETDFGFGMEREVIRLIRLRYWNPATKNGGNVDSYKKVFVTFKVK